MGSPALEAQQLQEVRRQIVKLGAALFPTQKALGALAQAGIDRLPHERIDAVLGLRNPKRIR